MTMLSFKKVDSNHRKNEPCEHGRSWIMNVFHCLDFGYHKYGIIFSI